MNASEMKRLKKMKKNERKMIKGGWWRSGGGGGGVGKIGLGVCVCEIEFISFLLLSGLRRVSGHLSLEQSET